MRIYTGVGSRETPIEIQNVMTRVAEDLGESGWLLRSGGAAGADRAFETGVDTVFGPKEIYLPWPGFSYCNRCESKTCPHMWTVGQASSLDLKARKIAESVHPNWKAVESINGGITLHTRNAYQVLGKNLNRPSEVLICWTPHGNTIGGTATAIRLAHKREVPVINLGEKHWTIRKLVKHVKGLR